MKNKGSDNYPCLGNIMKIVNILIVEDEPVMCQFYKMSLDQIDSVDFRISVCNTFDAAHQNILEVHASKNNIDLILLDIRLRDLKTKVVKDGRNLGLLLRSKLPNTKIVFVTSIVSHYDFYDIFQLINPEGFIVKNEIDHEQFASILKDILNEKSFYSTTVNNFLYDQGNGIIRLDQTDRKLLLLLTNGIKTKNLACHLNLSLSAIEKRKRNIAKIFGLNGTDNEGLIKKARNKMII